VGAVLGVIRTVHAWAGALLSLLLIAIGLSGALLVFKADWLRLTVPAARAAVASTPQVLGGAANALQAMHPGHIQRIEFAGPDLGVHQVTLHGGYGYAAADGRLVAEWSGPTRPETWLYDLHHFLLSGDSGMLVVGAVGLAAAVLILTGLVVWAPGARNFRLRFWPRSAQRRDLLAVHRNLGVIFALPLLLFCLSGSGLIFFKTAQAWLGRLFPEQVEEQFFTPAYAGTVDWTKALAAAQASFPRARLTMAIFPPEPGDAAIVRLKQAREWTPIGNTEVFVDPSSNTVMGVRDALAARRSMRLFNALYPLHTAKVGGRAYDAIAFLSGLAVAGLGGLGLWSFVIKPRRRKPAPAATR
jgi:uncharacterized iron-regulated membrane protein